MKEIKIFSAQEELEALIATVYVHMKNSQTGGSSRGVVDIRKQKKQFRRTKRTERRR